MSQFKSSSPLVSVIVLSYKNVEYLNECLDSILTQTYDNIELIVSNDGADEFDENEYIDYIRSNRTEHISNVIVNKNPHNYGTVKHCNTALDLSSGDYIMLIACDDMYSNDDAVKNMVEGLMSMPSEVMSVVSQTAMYDSDMKECLELFVTEDNQKLINELTPYELYRNHLVYKPIMPAASRIYKREAFDKYGRFDEKYFLVEDVTSAISHAKQGMVTRYLDIMCVNHRDGGVSHSELNPNSFAQKMYHKDLIALWNDVLDDSENLETEVKLQIYAKLLTHKVLLNKIEPPPCKPVSVIILSAPNNEYLTSCIDSVFFQQYPKIEMIICHDNLGTDNSEFIHNYVNGKTKARDSVDFRLIECNGASSLTQQCNIALDAAKGEYVVVLSSDDKFTNSHSIERLVSGYQISPKDTMSVVCQTTLYDEDYRGIIGYYVAPETRKQLYEMSPHELYIAYEGTPSIIPPASRIFKKTAFELYGKFDEGFDYPTYWPTSPSDDRIHLATHYIDVECVDHRRSPAKKVHQDINQYSEYVTPSTLKDIFRRAAPKFALKSYRWVKRKLVQ